MSTLTLAERVEAFHLLELPGQPKAMHMGTSYLVSDLWRALQEVEDSLAATHAALELARSRSGLDTPQALPTRWTPARTETPA